LHLHLQSLPDEGVVNTQASDPQQSVTAQAGSANTSGTDANSLETAPLHAGNNPSLPQQLISQLTTILQQAQNPARTSATQQDTIEDDSLSAASLLVRSNPNPGVQAATLHTLSQAILNPGSTTTMQQETQLPQPVVPPIPSRIPDKIARGEHIDFTTLLPKSMFGAPESWS